MTNETPAPYYCGFCGKSLGEEGSPGCCGETWDKAAVNPEDVVRVEVECEFCRAIVHVEDLDDEGRCGYCHERQLIHERRSRA